MTKAVIFDLDSCLAPADEPGRDLYQPAFDAIVRAHQGSHSQPELATAFSDMWRLPFDFVANKHRFTLEMRKAGWNAFADLEVKTPMRGYGDLDALKQLCLPTFLVTSGFRRLQESKINALGIRPLFAEIHIDAINETGRRGKEGVIVDILAVHQLRPSEALIVGDNADSELGIGERLGIPTVQTLRPGVPRWPRAKHHISNLGELLPLIDVSNT